jgi:hypothetical protein
MKNAYRIGFQFAASSSTHRAQGQSLPASFGASNYKPQHDQEIFSDYDAYSVGGWDGFEADPISRDTVFAARSFYRLLPMGHVRADIAPGADGTIGFEWRIGSRDNRTMILVDVGPADRVRARRVDRNGRSTVFPETSTGMGARNLVAELFQE